MAHRNYWLVILLLFGSTVSAGEADVIDVKASCKGKVICDFHVTVSHADAGWEHDADRWEIRSADGQRIGVRNLRHPHDNEQPFARSLNHAQIPNGVNLVVVRARDSRHKYGGREISVKLDDQRGD